MPTLDVAAVAEWTGGHLVRGDPAVEVRGYEIDTRRVDADGCFFALRGSRVDGHDFLPAARRSGAVVAVVSRTVDAALDAPDALVRVDDVASALARLATRTRRERMTGVRTIAITGSAGKTSTKDALAAGAAATRRTHRTLGNYNNHLGVPLTLLACPDDAQVAVVEMGMNAPGEIAALMDIAAPDIGLVTNIGAAHLGNFADVDDVGAAKGEMYARLDDDAVAVVNADDHRCRLQAARHVGRQVRFGTADDVDVKIESVEPRFTPGTTVTLRVGDRVLKDTLRTGAGHAARNVAAAVAGLLAAGLDVAAGFEAMCAVEPLPGRGRVTTTSTGVTIVDDTYNSNPEALASVLDTLRKTACEGRKILVLGEMLELGDASSRLHREAGRAAARAGVELLVGVGPGTRPALDAARRKGVPEVHYDAKATGAARFVAERTRAGDLIVAKGSRSVGLERVVRTLIDDGGEPRSARAGGA